MVEILRGFRYDRSLSLSLKSGLTRPTRTQQTVVAWLFRESQPLKREELIIRDRKIRCVIARELSR
jgi:hypothetical protein